MEQMSSGIIDNHFSNKQQKVSLIKSFVPSLKEEKKIKIEKLGKIQRILNLVFSLLVLALVLTPFSISFGINATIYVTPPLYEYSTFVSYFKTTFRITTFLLYYPDAGEFFSNVLYAAYLISALLALASVILSSISL